MQADTPKPWRVEVVEDATQEVVKTIPCHTKREAERVERGPFWGESEGDVIDHYGADVVGAEHVTPPYSGNRVASRLGDEVTVPKELL